MGKTTISGAISAEMEKEVNVQVIFWLLIAIVAVVAFVIYFIRKRRRAHTQVQPASMILLTPQQRARQAAGDKLRNRSARNSPPQTTSPTPVVTPVTPNPEATTAASPVAATQRQSWFKRLFATFRPRLPKLKFGLRAVLLGGFVITCAVLAAVNLLKKHESTPKGSKSSLSTKYTKAAEDLAQSLIIADLKVEAATGLFSYPYGPELRDFFNLGDESTARSGEEAWVALFKQCPPDFKRANTSFSQECQENYVSYVAVLNLQNGKSVEEIIVAWPTIIKGWKSDARLDDAAGWQYASEYSDSLRVEYLKTYEGRSFGTNVTAKALITPDSIQQQPFTWDKVWLWLIVSFAGYFILFWVLFIGIKRKKKLLTDYNVWAIIPGAISGWLGMQAIIAPGFPQQFNNRQFVVIGLGVLLAVFSYAMFRNGYEENLPK